MRLVLAIDCSGSMGECAKVFIARYIAQTIFQLRDAGMISAQVQCVCVNEKACEWNDISVLPECKGRFSLESLISILQEDDCVLVLTDCLAPRVEQATLIDDNLKAKKASLVWVFCGEESDVHVASDVFHVEDALLALKKLGVLRHAY